MKQYTLLTRPPLKRKKSFVVQSLQSERPDLENLHNEQKVSPYEELLEYRPLFNKIDKLLHEGILDEDDLFDPKASYSKFDKLPSTLPEDEEEERLEMYFDEYFHPTQNVNAFL